jgi:hypothetical protein
MIKELTSDQKQMLLAVQGRKRLSKKNNLPPIDPEAPDMSGHFIYEVVIRTIVQVDAQGNTKGVTTQTALMPPEQLEKAWLHEGLPTADGNDALMGAYTNALRGSIVHAARAGVSVVDSFKQTCEALRNLLQLGRQYRTEKMYRKL